MSPAWLRPAFFAAAFCGALHAPNASGPHPEAIATPLAVPMVQLTAPMPDNIPCHVLPEYTRLDYRLPRLARKLETGAPVVIVALGSSSTQGIGATSPFASYPARLQSELRRMYQSDAITVINSGVGGETAGDMLARLERDVLDKNPDLVIFQGDVNSVLRDARLEPAIGAMEGIITILHARGIDVVLMDAQYAPRVNAMPGAARMQAANAALGRTHRIGVFGRNALMRHWHEKEGMAYSRFLSPDDLHMKDWSYACTARVLAHAISNAAGPFRMTYMP